MNGAPYPTNRKGKTNPNSEGNTDLKNGRSKSSAFQKKSLGKRIEGAANTDAGQEIIGHLGKSLIDKLFNRGRMSGGMGGIKKLFGGNNNGI